MTKGEACGGRLSESDDNVDHEKNEKCEQYQVENVSIVAGH